MKTNDRLKRIERAAFIPDTRKFGFLSCDIEYYLPVSDVLEALLEQLGFSVSVEPAKPKKIILKKNEPTEKSKK